MKRKLRKRPIFDIQVGQMWMARNGDIYRIIERTNYGDNAFSVAGENIDRKRDYLTQWFNGYFSPFGENGKDDPLDLLTEYKPK